MTFEQFDNKIGDVIARVTGFLHLAPSDFEDANWRDLFDATNNGDACTDEQIIDTLARADDNFVELLAMC